MVMTIDEVEALIKTKIGISEIHRLEDAWETP